MTLSNYYKKVLTHVFDKNDTFLIKLCLKIYNICPSYPILPHGPTWSSCFEDKLLILIINIVISLK